jgi:hypothetical protein
VEELGGAIASATVLGVVDIPLPVMSHGTAAVHARASRFTFGGQRHWARRGGPWAGRAYQADGEFPRARPRRPVLSTGTSSTVGADGMSPRSWELTTGPALRTMALPCGHRVHRPNRTSRKTKCVLNPPFVRHILNPYIDHGAP